MRKLKEPRRLSQAVWFPVAFNMGCSRGWEQYQTKLKKDSLKFTVDDAGKECMTLTIEQTVIEKNHQGGPSKEGQVSQSTRMYDCDIGPDTRSASSRSALPVETEPKL